MAFIPVNSWTIITTIPTHDPFQCLSLVKASVTVIVDVDF